jgi:hypothetical protein
MHSGHSSSGGLRRFLRSSPGLALLAFLAIAGFYLFTEHTAHLWGYLPYGLLLLCPLIHLFMHGGHSGHGGSSDQQPGDRQHRH